MLPTEAFADAVAFLRLFELSALAIANAMCSSLAIKASTSIRWDDFSGLHFDITDTWIHILRDAEMESADAPGVERWQLVAHLDFSGATDTSEFIVAAFPNCVLEDLAFLGPPSCWAGLVGAIRQVADSVVVKEALLQPQGMTPEDTFSLVRTFRKVKALELYGEVSDAKAEEMADFYRGSGIRELRYYRDPDDSALQILTLC